MRRVTTRIGSVGHATLVTAITHLRKPCLRSSLVRQQGGACPVGSADEIRHAAASPKPLPQMSLLARRSGPTSTPTPAGSGYSLLDAQLVVTGDLDTGGSLRIDGKLDGSVRRADGHDQRGHSRDRREEQRDHCAEHDSRLPPRDVERPCRRTRHRRHEKELPRTACERHGLRARPPLRDRWEGRSERLGTEPDDVGGHAALDDLERANRVDVPGRTLRR